MTDDGLITNRMLLEHIQALRNDMNQGFDRVDNRFSRLELRVDQLEQKVDRGFEEARQDRQIIREDLEATILTQFEQGKQIAVLAGKPIPEDY